MNLILDIGNTFIKWAVFNGVEMKDNGVLRKDAELSLFLTSNIFHQIDVCMLSTVGKVPMAVVDHLVQKKIDYYFLSHESSLPIINEYESPETLGVDRIAGVIGARSVNNENVLVIDIGTCVTYDCLSSAGIYKGGVISPGIQLRFNAMHDHTDKLPLIEWKDHFADEILKEGVDTETSMISGVINGMVNELSSWINEYEKLYKDLTVIMTGGDASYFESKLKSKIFVDQNIVLKGLNQILIHERSS